MEGRVEPSRDVSRTAARPLNKPVSANNANRYRFTGTTVRSRYTFRVVVPAESGYPYAQGSSKTTRVLVNP